MDRCANTLLVLATALLLAGCGADRPEWKAQDLSAAELQATKITLRDGSCAWGCWSYEVSVTGSGDVTSSHGGKVVRTAHLSEDDVRDLFGVFYRAKSQVPCAPLMVKDPRTGETNLESTVENCETYTQLKTGGVIGNDMPTTSLEVTVAGQTIFIYSRNLGAPEEFRDLEKRLRSFE